MKVIDFRIRPPFEDFLKEEASFFTQEKLDKFEKQTSLKVGVSARETSMEKCISEMDEAGIDIAVVSPRRKKGVSNQTIVDIVEKYPDRFIGLAGVDVFNVEEALDEIDKYIINGPLKGLTIECGFATDTPSMAFDDHRMYPIYDKCQKEGIFILYTTGLAFSSLEQARPTALDQVAIDFPDLKIVVSHACWPYVIEACWVALVRKNVYLSPDVYMFNTPGNDEYIMAINNMLKDKMIYGSAYPLASITESMNYTLNCGISDEAMPKYLYENAAKVLGLE